MRLAAKPITNLRICPQIFYPLRLVTKGADQQETADAGSHERNIEVASRFSAFGLQHNQTRRAADGRSKPDANPGFNQAIEATKKIGL